MASHQALTSLLHTISSGLTPSREQELGSAKPGILFGGLSALPVSFFSPLRNQSKSLPSTAAH